MKWFLPEDATEVCEAGNDMLVVCEKSFNKDKLRYRTHFRVRDPAPPVPFELEPPR